MSTRFEAYANLLTAKFLGGQRSPNKFYIYDLENVEGFRLLFP